MSRLHCLLSVAIVMVIAGESTLAQDTSTARDAGRVLRSAPAVKINAAPESSSPPSSVTIPRVKQPRSINRIEADSTRTSQPTDARPDTADQQAERPPQAKRQAALATFGIAEPAGFSASGRFLVGSQASGGLLLCDIANRRRLRRLEDSDRRYDLVAMSPKARWIAGVRHGNPGQVDLWRADNGRLIRTILAGEGAKRSLEFSEAGDTLNVLGSDGRGVTYSIPDGVATGGFASGSGRAAVKPRRVTVSPPVISPRTPFQEAAPSRAIQDAPSTQFPLRGQSPGGAGQSFAPPKPKYIGSGSGTAPADMAPSAPESSFPVAEPQFAAPAAPETAAPEMAAPEMAAPQIAAPSPQMEAPLAPRSALSPAATLPQAATLPPATTMMREEPAAAAPQAAMENMEAYAEPTMSPGAAAPEAFADEAAGSSPDAALAADAATESAAASAAAALPPEDLSSVTVHFATNRNLLTAADRQWTTYFTGFFGSLPAFVVYVVMLLAVLILPWFGKRSWAGLALVAGAVVLCAMGSLEAYVRSHLRDELSGELYGAQPSDLSYGTCQISVPRPENRAPGELNRPLSVWILEAPEDPEKHFVLQKVVEHADKDAFYQSLSGQLAKSADGTSLLFIHGYNVSFEDAIFRTAQLAVDLKFPGARSRSVGRRAPTR